MPKKASKKKANQKSGNKTAVKKNLETLEKLSLKLLSLIGVKSEVEVKEDTENDAFIINIKGENETGLLIGARGKTLFSLQTVLGLMYNQKSGGDWKRVLVNISDYREKEEERLVSLAGQSAERARSTKEPQYLYNLTASQRRIVHMALSKETDIETNSEGEGADRHLIVTPKK